MTIDVFRNTWTALQLRGGSNMDFRSPTCGLGNGCESQSSGSLVDTSNWAIDGILSTVESACLADQFTCYLVVDFSDAGDHRL
jgi:hypothetical protein